MKSIIVVTFLVVAFLGLPLMICGNAAPAYAQGFIDYEQDFDRQDLHPDTTKENIYTLLYGPFGMLGMIVAAFAAVVSFITGGSGRHSKGMKATAVICLLIALAIFTIRLLISSGTIEIIQQRSGG